MNRYVNVFATVLMIIFLVGCGGRSPNLDVEGVWVSEEGTVYYVVKPDETLWGISQKVNVPLETILDLNHLDENMIIYPGQRLSIGSVDEETAATYLPTQEAGPGT